MRHLPTYFVLAALAPAVLGAQTKADLVLVNGKVYTVDNVRPMASALAVRGGRVLFVGSPAEARGLAPPFPPGIDLHRKKGIPGIIHCHPHPPRLRHNLPRVNLPRPTAYDEVIARVKTLS